MPIIVILAVAAILVTLFYFRVLGPGQGRKCRWSRAPDTHRTSHLERWLCESCGVDAYSTDGRPPKECKRMLKSGM